MTRMKLSRRLPALSIDILWPLIILAAYVFYTALVPQPPNDLWWHLKIGEYVYTQKAVPTTNLFAWTLPADQPFFYAAWLGEWLLYVLYRLGGIDLTLFVRNLLTLATFGLLAWEMRQRSGSWRISALTLTPAALMCMNVPLVRTQMWCWLPFMFFLILLRRYTRGEIRPAWLLALPGLMILWVNLHGTFIMGLVLVGAYLVGEAIRALLRPSEALPWKKIAWLGAVGLLAALATLLNPRTYEIFGYITNLMTDQPVQQLVEEWKSPVPLGLANTTFYISILALIVTLAYSRLRPSPTDTLLLVGFLWLAWDGQRSILWYAMAAMPILAEAISQLPISIPSPASQRSLVNTLAAGILFVPFILVQPWLVERFPLPPTYWEQVHQGVPEGRMLSSDTPITAVQYLKEHPGGNLFHEMGFGSYLIWALPEQGVFVDTRIELYPYTLWSDYIHISQGVRYNALLEQYEANRLLLHTGLQSGLVEQLTSDPTWALEYADDSAQVWCKANACPSP